MSTLSSKEQTEEELLAHAQTQTEKAEKEALLASRKGDWEGVIRAVLEKTSIEEKLEATIKAVRVRGAVAEARARALAARPSDSADSSVGDVAAD